MCITGTSTGVPPPALSGFHCGFTATAPLCHTAPELSRTNTTSAHNPLQIFSSYYRKCPILTKAQNGNSHFRGISEGSITLTLHTALPGLRHKVLLLQIGEIPNSQRNRGSSFSVSLIKTLLHITAQPFFLRCEIISRLGIGGKEEESCRFCVHLKKGQREEEIRKTSSLDLPADGRHSSPPSPGNKRSGLSF